MAQNKTKFTDASVDDYLAVRGSEQQRADCRELITLLKKATHQAPRMWGPSIVGSALINTLTRADILERLH